MRGTRIYSRGSVERGLDHHVAGRWDRAEDGRYRIRPFAAPILVLTLKEVHAYVVGLADGRTVERNVSEVS